MQKAMQKCLCTFAPIGFSHAGFLGHKSCVNFQLGSYAQESAAWCQNLGSEVIITVLKTLFIVLLHAPVSLGSLKRIFLVCLSVCLSWINCSRACITNCKCVWRKYHDPQVHRSCSVNLKLLIQQDIFHQS